jgi:hypothetical protein
MICETVKKGVDCAFMGKSGCQFNGGACHPIVEQCVGCQKVKEFPTGKYCLSFPEPAVKWRTGRCPMATHLQMPTQKPAVKVNPLKASKRAVR